MKLYGLAMSPFVARVRIALELKGCSYDMISPPGGCPGSEEFRTLNPIGKIPVLETRDGLLIAESESIVDYLDDLIPDPPLLPLNVALRIQVRNAVRVVEAYAVPALLRLFPQLEPRVRLEATVDAEWMRLTEGVEFLVPFVRGQGTAAGGTPTKADCILVPTFMLVRIIADVLDKPDPIDAHPLLIDYEAKALAHPVIGKVMAQTRAALAEVA